MKENILERLKTCKTLVECARLLKGIDYTNGRIKKELTDLCLSEYGIDILETIKQNNKHYCLHCGKEIQTGRKFCNSSCAAKYNNAGRTLSDDTKNNISNGLRKYYDIFTHNGKLREDYIKEHTFICKTCGKEFFSENKNIRFCSNICAQSNEETKEKIRNKAKERINNNTFSGWKSRGVRSYPEKFWEGVLKNNLIEFVPEDFSTKKYFLDFLIEKDGKKIDLEIDGKQHNRRKEHDAERDDFLSKNGFIVYRVKWNSINSEIGRTIMKEKVDAFLRFYEEI